MSDPYPLHTWARLGPCPAPNRLPAIVGDDQDGPERLGRHSCFQPCAAGVRVDAVRQLKPGPHIYGELLPSPGGRRRCGHAIEQAAIQASCETRRLVGQHAQAFAVTALPLIDHPAPDLTQEVLALSGSAST